MNQPVKISFHTLGCRLNQAESASLENLFRAAGYDVVAFGESADVVVINTCTVTKHGDADTRRLVHRLHKRFANTRIALIGCQSQVQGEVLLQLPGVQWVIGTAAKMDLPQIFQQHSGVEPVLIVPEIPPRSACPKQAKVAAVRITTAVVVRVLRDILDPFLCVGGTQPNDRPSTGGIATLASLSRSPC